MVSVEPAVAWKVAVEHHQRTCPHLDRLAHRDVGHQTAVVELVTVEVDKWEDARDRRAGQQSGQQRTVTHNVWPSGGDIRRDCGERQCQISECRCLPDKLVITAASPVLGNRYVLTLCSSKAWASKPPGNT